MVISVWLCSLQCTCKPSKSKYFETDFHQWNHADVKQCRYLIWKYGCQNTTSHSWKTLLSVNVKSDYLSCFWQLSFIIKWPSYKGGYVCPYYEFQNLSFFIWRRNTCCCQYFAIVFALFSVAVLTHLCHLCYLMLLFQGPDVACQNFTLTGPL